MEEYRNVGAYTEGREIFEYLLKNPFEGAGTMLELQVGIALQSIRLGELDKADAAVEKLIADYNDNPNIGKALFQIAEEHYYAGNLGKAMELWELVRSDYWSSEFDNKQEVSFMLGNCHQLLDKHGEAIEYYKRSVQEYPAGRRAADACYETGMIYFLRQKDYEQAIEWLERCLEVRRQEEGPGERCLFHLIVIYTQKLERYEEGIAAARQYLAEYPAGGGCWGVMSNLARCYEKLGETAQAIATLEESLEVTDSNNVRAAVAERIGRLQKGGAQ